MLSLLMMFNAFCFLVWLLSFLFVSIVCVFVLSLCVDDHVCCFRFLNFLFPDVRYVFFVIVDVDWFPDCVHMLCVLFVL